MIIQTVTDSFVQELLQGVHDFDNDTFKLALYTANASLDETTVSYIATGEVVGFGYTTGGNDMTGLTVGSGQGVTFIGFDDVVWPLAQFTVRGGLIYNASKGNRSVAVLNFGADKTSTFSFTVQMPPTTATSALIRISKGANDGS